MTRVLFHSLTIPPDNVSTGKLVADIANKFSENGQHIEILASTPQYNFDENVINNELIKIKDDQVKTTLAVRQNNKFLQPPYSYSEMETLSHEVGHLLHQQLSKNTIPDFLKGYNFDVSLAKEELVAVSKRMRPNLWNDKHIKSYKGDIPDKVKQRHLDQVYYRNKDVELLADFIKGYLVDPKLTKRLAPTMSKILRNMVNESWFADILKLAKADTMPKDGLLKKQGINSGLLKTAMV